jgi:energy-coupling factor transporter ATP-binding protein EcfA2
MSTNRTAPVQTAKSKRPARITYLKVENFRALRKVEFKNLTPLTVLLGPNGSGKSTVFDVFAFLSECFESGLRRAWDRRGRAKELKTRGSDGPLVIEIKYSEPGFPLITYHLAVDEVSGSPVVVEEWLRWKRGSYGQPFRFLDYREGRGKAVSGEMPDVQDTRRDIPLQSVSSPIIHGSRRYASSSPVGTFPIYRSTTHAVSRRLVHKNACPAPAITLQMSSSISGNSTLTG